MNTKRIVTGALVVSVMQAGSALLGVGEKEEKTRKPLQVVIGTFDSRAVMLASFNPSQRVLDMKNKAPLSEAEIMAHED